MNLCIWDKNFTMENPQHGKATSKYSQGEPTSMFTDRCSPFHLHILSGLSQWTGHIYRAYYFKRLIRSVRALLVRKKKRTHTHRDTHTHQAKVGAIGNIFCKGINTNPNQLNRYSNCLRLPIKDAYFKIVYGLFWILICLENSKSQTDSCWSDR